MPPDTLSTLALLESVGPCFCHISNVLDEGRFGAGQEVRESGAEDFEIAFQRVFVRWVMRVEPSQIAEQPVSGRPVNVVRKPFIVEPYSVLRFQM